MLAIARLIHVWTVWLYQWKERIFVGAGPPVDTMDRSKSAGC